MTQRRPGVPRQFGLGRIALRQLRSRLALAAAQGLTLAAAATLVASVVLIQNQVTDSGLRSALANLPGEADLLVERDGLSMAPAYDAFQRDTSARVRAELGDSVIAGAQFGRSTAQMIRTIDGVKQGPPFTWNPSVVYYAGLRDHVHVVAGRWPGDVRSGADWLITMSAHATDDLGTPLSVRVGQEYCFGPAFNRGNAIASWCGRVAATWLPNDPAEVYWAGHVPETDVATGHDSFFAIIAGFPRLVNSTEQQYAPNPARITAANADAVVAAVNRLRGYYGVSGNDVFVSGLDSTVSGFLARQAAAAGPTLVSAFGLLVVAVAAMGFAALQFIQGHSAQAALWRARGWSRPRVWRLAMLEFAVLAVIAMPLAVITASLISAGVAGSTAASPGWGWRSMAAAAAPAGVAMGVFLLILGVLAAALSAPELTQRRRDRSATRGRNLRRRAVDVGAGILGIAGLLFVAFGVVATPGEQSNTVVLALPVLAVGLLAFASLRLVGVAARVLTMTRSLGGRLARWQLERDPAQYSRLCLLVTLAVAVGVFASTYVASDRASAIDRADYATGADVRATFSSAASPPRLTELAASLPSGVNAAQVFRGAGRPGRSGSDATILGVQGSDFWNIAYARSDFASRPMPALTSMVTSADPDGLAVRGEPSALVVSVYSSGLDARMEMEITDSANRDVLLPLGTLGTPGWRDLTASIAAPGLVAFPIRVRALRAVPTGAVGGDVAVQDLRTQSGVILESFTTTDGWWREAFAPDTAEGMVSPSALHVRGGRPSVDVSVDLQTVIIQPPPSPRPLPVLLAGPTLSELGLSLGQSFPLHVDTVDIELVAVGTFDSFPTYYPARESLIVVPLSSFLARLDNQGGTSPWANELWLSVPGGDAAAVSSTLAADSTLLHTYRRSDAENQAISDPLRVGLQDELGLGFIVALAVVVVGFGLFFLAAARNRATQFAIMRANGVPESVLRRSLIAEQIVVLLTGLVAGTLIGLAAAWAVLPIFNLGTLPEDLTPASVFHINPITLVAVVLGTGATALLMGQLVARSGSRVDVMNSVRSLA